MKTQRISYPFEVRSFNANDMFLHKKIREEVRQGRHYRAQQVSRGVVFRETSKIIAFKCPICFDRCCFRHNPVGDGPQTLRAFPCNQGGKHKALSFEPQTVRQHDCGHMLFSKYYTLFIVFLSSWCVCERVWTLICTVRPGTYVPMCVCACVRLCVMCVCVFAVVCACVCARCVFARACAHLPPYQTGPWCHVILFFKH